MADKPGMTWKNEDPIVQQLTDMIGEHMKEGTIPVPLELAVKIAFALAKLDRIEKAMKGGKAE